MDIDAPGLKGQITEEQEKNQQMDHVAKTELAQVDLYWHHKSEWFLVQWVHDTLGHQEMQHINGFMTSGCA